MKGTVTKLTQESTSIKKIYEEQNKNHKKF